MKKLFILTIGLGAQLLSAAQDLHFSRIHEMKSWYNQSLQYSRLAGGALNYRTLDYQGIIAFRTATMVADVPLLKRDARTNGNGGYATLSGGASLDKSNSQVLRNTNAMLGVAYSLPVNAARNTLVSAGFQGAFFQNMVNLNGATFPDQYDKFRLVPNRATNDPYRSSEVHYYSLNAGLSVFHNDERNSWYAGASVRHLNEPQASNNSGAGYRLPRTASVQLGYSRRLDEDQRIALHSALNWKAEAQEHLVNFQYNYEFNRTGYDRGLGAGVGYRYQDAIIPNVEVRLGKTTFGFNYDINIAGIRQTGMKRHSLEFGIRQVF